MVGSMSPIPPSLWQLLLQTAQHDQNFVFLNQTWGPLTYITAHIEPHMQTAAGHQLLRQTAPPETYSKFKYRMKKKHSEHFLNRTVFKTDQLAKATCAEIVLRVTCRQLLYWHICDAVHIGWWNEWEAGKPELGGRLGKQTESRWDVPRGQPMLHPSSNDQHYHFRNFGCMLHCWWAGWTESHRKWLISNLYISL